MPHADRDVSVVVPPLTVSPQDAAGVPTEPSTTPEIEAPPLQKVARAYLLWLMIASFGASLALMVPLSYSLAVRIDDLAPGHEERLGYVTGSAQFVYLVLSPLIGLWSDRTRSRLGRRTPFMIGGAVLGTVALVGVALAPSVLLLGLAWVVGMIGWSTTGQAVQNVQADRCPRSSAAGYRR